MKRYFESISKAIVFVVLIGVFLYGFQSADKGLDVEDSQRAKVAIQKAARECYSIEGAYPKSIEYLKKNYGLYIQSDKYNIRYTYVGANIMPDTDVFKKGE
ncbi:MAG: hypothetical protein RR602_02555 [Longicatena sp.]